MPPPGPRRLPRPRRANLTLRRDTLICEEPAYCPNARAVASFTHAPPPVANISPSHRLKSRGVILFTVVLMLSATPVSALADEVDAMSNSTRSIQESIEGLPLDTQNVLANIASDPRFGDTNYAEEMLEDYPELTITTSSGFVPGTPVARRSLADSTDHSVAPAAVGNRAWVTKNWKILGITYASITTEANYNNSGARVTKVNSCWNSHSDYIGVRFISGNSYHGLSAGILTCSTDWVLKKGTGETRASQGFKVTGNGSFLDSW